MGAGHEPIGLPALVNTPVDPGKQWEFHMLKLINKLWQDESGAAAAEYALILAIVGAVIGTAMIGLRTEILTSITNATTEIASVN